MDRDTDLQTAADMLGRTLLLAGRFDVACRERDTWARMCAEAVLESRAADATYWARKYLEAQDEAGALVEAMRNVTGSGQAVGS